MILIDDVLDLSILLVQEGLMGQGVGPGVLLLGFLRSLSNVLAAHLLVDDLGPLAEVHVLWL